MPVQPVSQNFSVQPASATATQTFAPRPGDTLSQASKPESGDGFIMSILKPIGRFFANLVSYFKYICCCCTDKSFQADLPKFTAAELKGWLGDEYEVVQKSDTSFELTQGDITFTLEMVPYEGSFAVKLKRGEEFWDTEWFKNFLGSPTLILEGISDDDGEDIEGAAKNSDGLWVIKGPLENVLAVNGGETDIQLLLPSGSKFVPIHLEDSQSQFNWLINDLEKSPELLPQIVEWAKATRCHEGPHQDLVHLQAKAEADSSLAKALLAAGFEEDDGVYSLELPKLEKK